MVHAELCQDHNIYAFVQPIRPERIANAVSLTSLDILLSVLNRLIFDFFVIASSQPCQTIIKTYGMSIQKNKNFRNF